MSDDLKKQHAKLKRKAVEVAGQIHDIVEDTLWTDHVKLEELGKQCSELCKEAEAFKKENGL